MPQLFRSSQQANAALRPSGAGIIATRTQVCRALSSSIAALADSQAFTSTSTYLHYVPDGAVAVKLRYSNTVINSDNSEANATTALTIAAGIESPDGQVMQATFNGALTFTLAANAEVDTDWVALPVPAGPGSTIKSRNTIIVTPGDTVIYPVSGQPAVFVNSNWPIMGGDGIGCRVVTASNATPIVVTTAGNHNATQGQLVRIAGVLGNTNANGDHYVSVLSATTIALYSDSGLTTARAGNGAYTNNTGVVYGTNLSLTGSGACRARSSGETNYWGPVAIVGAPVAGQRPASIAIIGDSIAAGAGGAVTLAGQGFPDIAFNVSNGRANTNLARGSTQALQWNVPLNSRRRRITALNADYIVCNYGTNDLAASSYPALQADLIKLHTYYAAAGKRTVQTTIPPRTTSSDSFATATNQTFEGVTNVSAATNATPIVVTATAHRLTTGQRVQISGVGGNTAANGTWWVEVLTTNTIGLYSDVARTSPVAGNGSYTSGGTVAAKESNRAALNDWLLDGAPLLNGVAAAVGSQADGVIRTAVTSGGVTTPGSGSTRHPIWRVIDFCQPLEVDSTNTLTRNGGRWLANGTANYLTADGIHPSAAGHILLAGLLPPSMFPNFDDLPVVAPVI